MLGAHQHVMHGGEQGGNKLQRGTIGLVGEHVSGVKVVQNSGQKEVQRVGVHMEAPSKETKSVDKVKGALSKKRVSFALNLVSGGDLSIVHKRKERWGRVNSQSELCGAPQ